jgi:uncharacterized protein (TIGR03084 family)
VDYESLCADLEAEEAALDAVVAGLADDAWSTPTPAEGWDVRDSIGHLAMSEDMAALSTKGADLFNAELARLLEGGVDALSDRLVGPARSMTPPEVLKWWRDSRGATLTGLRGHDPKDRLAWFAGPMSAMSFATARLMETWAHGQDIVDALGVTREPTARLRHVAEIGVRTRPHTFRNRGLAEPDEPVFVALEGPAGDEWTWGDPSAPDRVTGSALDFCLVVTQRRNPRATSLEIEGRAAGAWIDIAQAFAGPATDHRRA